MAESQQAARRYAVLQAGARMHYAVPALLARASALAAFYTDIGIYDPFLTRTWSVSELEDAEADARRRGLPLLVAFGHRSLLQQSHPALIDYIESSGRYEKITELHGTGDQQFNHLIYRWVGDNGNSD